MIDYQISVEYIGDLRTKSIHQKSSSELITDAPLDNEGSGRKFSPTDLVTSSLASCMLTIIAIFFAFLHAHPSMKTRFRE